jgi:imidazolonepropionase-like amidohydrolase
MRIERTGSITSLKCAAVLVAVAWPFAAHAQSPLRQPAVAITDVVVIDVERGHPTGARTVLVEAGRIAAIVAPGEARIPAHADRVDGRGKFLIPGLVDMHVHLFNTWSKRPPNDWTFPLFIANGVTGVREMNADAASIAMIRRWRRAFDQGSLLAPRILAAGVSVRGISPDDARRGVDAAADAGTDFIKIFSNVPATHWRAIIETARRRALPVAGHVPVSITLQTAAETGQRSGEHLTQAYEACSTFEARLIAARVDLADAALDAVRAAQDARMLDAFDEATCMRVATSLARSGQAQVPTLVLPWRESIRTDAAPESDPRWRSLRADERERWQRSLAEIASIDDPLAQQRWKVSRLIVAAFHRAGVTFLAGTDAPMPRVYPGYSLHEELALLVESGLTPSEALRAATLAPARFLGFEATAGTVAVGKRADLVLLDADPTLDIRNSQRIDAVLIDGRLLRRADLDALLQEAVRVQSRPGASASAH